MEKLKVKLMEINKFESLLIDYIDGKLSETERQEVEYELAQNPESFKLYEQLQEVLSAISKSGEIEPGEKLRLDFEKVLKIEMEASRKLRSSNRQVFFQPVIFPPALSYLHGKGEIPP